MRSFHFFHENPYFQYFCGQDTFVAKLNRRVFHPSLLSKRRRRLGIEYMNTFDAEVLKVFDSKRGGQRQETDVRRNHF